ncbi:GNAT family N-acetyltransferase [Virgibacillus sp. M23]|uniref:GNAT family N-acetyltransferase n=1 Tax=Virgibacillus sp. M23 TaxID=3079030 RepID=UPI002A912689|nr:GNAT family N-acetyltransferase [Virgibacillus sp. M23]MDY7045373.1 GNAT family N-acetyltransferase [Virgibacillus sp. M23]
MLKARDLHEVPVLFELLVNPAVFPYVRHKANTTDEYYFITKQTMEAEERGELISRTILDEYGNPIGTINLFDIQENYGFLATWIGKPYFGKGYNKQAKEQFFNDIFSSSPIEGVFMKVRKSNIRSLKAVSKLPYVTLANVTYQEVFHMINLEAVVYDLFVVTKQQYLSYQQFSTNPQEATEEEVG